MQRLVVQTADGSSSVYVPDLNESYHSRHGSVQESQHVFIQAGLAETAKRKKEITALEIGFGTGLNSLLAYLFARENQLAVHYHAIESFPLENDILIRLNFSDILPDDENTFQKLHKAEWNKSIRVAPFFMLEKYAITLQDFQWEGKADVVFFDAFAPRVQPELWTAEIFSKLYGMMNAGGILVTYCAKGEVKRNLKKAGFSVEALPGPAGKREMTRAIKS